MQLFIFFTAVLIGSIRGDSPPIEYNDDGLNLEEEVKFFLFTKQTTDDPEQLYVNDTETLKESAYNVFQPTKLVTHGWGASYPNSSTSIRQALVADYDCNVVVAEWVSISKKEYKEAAPRVRVMGQYVGKMAQFLINQGTDPLSMSLIGHSLGAHIMGFAGKSLNPKVSQLVGLDPAGVGFDPLDSNDRLSPNDAERVEVISTNRGQLGIKAVVGYANFYPNGGGPQQPGCPDDDKGTCSHSRSYIYYVEAITNPNNWYARKCNSYDDFNNNKCSENEVVPFPGWYQSYAGQGKYMLRTNSESPYDLGYEGINPSVE